MTPSNQTQSALRAALEAHQAGRLADAETAYRRILASEPKQPDALHLLAMLTRDTGRLEEAERFAAAAVASNSSISLFHATLGEIYRGAGKFELAAASLQRSTKLDPNVADVHNTLGVTMKLLGKNTEALAAFSAAIKCDPAFANVRFNLALALTQARRFGEAMEQWRAYIEANPNDPDAFPQFGSCLMWAGKLKESEEICRQGIELKPDSADAYNSLGACLRHQGRMAEAIAACRNAIVISPNHAFALSNLGADLADQNQFEEAITHLCRAIGIEPNLDEAHWNLAMAYLRSGDFERGWPEYEWRLKNHWAVLKLRFSQPRWEGGDLRGKTILLHCEQGLGDTLQFIRYVPQLAQKGGRIILGCPKELTRLFAEFPGISKVLSEGERPGPFDVYCPLLSLPLIFGTRLQTIPAHVQYICASSEISCQWAACLGPANGKIRVGLAWAGSPTHRDDVRRSIPLAQFAPLAVAENVEFHSLQKGPAAKEADKVLPGMVVIDHADELHDFADTAGLMEQLDLVISVDTAPVHLAGAMGKPVWVLVPQIADWRWMTERTDSPWYPTMRLFRQKFAGEWSEAIEAVARDLVAFVKGR